MPSSEKCELRSYCHNGHLFDAPNTYLTKDPKPYRQCRQCARDRKARYRAEDEARVLKIGVESMARRRARNPTRFDDNRRSATLKFHYGLTVHQYDQMLIDQGGLCAICRRPEHAKLRDGRTKRLAVDHDHHTGAIRGLLCSACNRALGYFDDDISNLSKAAEYLTKPAANAA